MVGPIVLEQHTCIKCQLLEHTYDCLLTQFFFHWLELFKKLAKDNLNSYVQGIVSTFGDKIVTKTTCIVYTGVNFLFNFFVWIMALCYILGAILFLFFVCLVFDGCKKWMLQLSKHCLFQWLKMTGLQHNWTDHSQTQICWLHLWH